MKPVVFLNSHPIQYFAPLYQYISEQTVIDLEVVYCSDESIKGNIDKGFGTSVKWDIPLLTGYKSRFLKNRARKPSIYNGFWGLFNPGIIKYLYKKEPSILIVHGWAHATNIMAIIAGKFTGHTVCIRAETPHNQELLKNKYITFLKHVYLRFIFLFADKFLYIGLQNKLFYKSLGIAEDRLIFTPYCVDNARFREIFENIGREEARVKLGLPKDGDVILYSGKYTAKKRPLDLLKAFSLLDKKKAILVMVGDGELRTEMEVFIERNSLKGKVVLTGFVNQSLIPYYYRAADVFVMCSGLGETWGLSVNEAMNFGSPVIVSDTCGCGYDLVEIGINGKIFETGNIEQLSTVIADFLDQTPTKKDACQQNALKIIDQYSYKQIVEGILGISS